MERDEQTYAIIGAAMEGIGSLVTAFSKLARLGAIEEAQVQNYLKATRLQRALISTSALPVSSTKGSCLICANLRNLRIRFISNPWENQPASSNTSANFPADRAPLERVRDWGEFHFHMAEEKLRNQGARCMDCGVPFCHTGTLISGMASGCPINNLIPEWNDLVYRGLWKEGA
jgi:hypothetical protein